jgi:hypothetical protein
MAIISLMLGIVVGIVIILILRNYGT